MDQEGIAHCSKGEGILDENSLRRRSLQPSFLAKLV